MVDAQSCEQACNMRAAYIDSCLDMWDEDYTGDGGAGIITWSITGYENADVWREVCKAEFREAIKFSSIEGQRLIRQYCSNDIADIWQANHCWDYTPDYSSGVTQEFGIPTAGGSHNRELQPEVVEDN